MKFYNIITTHNQSFIISKIKDMSDFEVENIQNIYKKFSMVEYTNESGHECMFAIIDDFLLEKISKIYTSYDLEFQIIDMTKHVKFDINFRTSYKNEYGLSVKRKILSLIKEYKQNWTDKDDILDKILEKGIDSLTDFDLDILNS
jgi:hypothetical protein